MKLTFLGTSGGKPTKNRNSSAIALECENERGWYLFDCAEATQHQILKSHLSASKLKAIFITHTHGDHCYGLPGLLTSMMLDGRSEPLAIFAPKELRNMIEAFVDVSLEHLGYEVSWHTLHGGFEVNFEKFRLKALPLIHSIECYAFFIVTHPTIHIDAIALKADGLPPGPLYATLKAGLDVKYEGKLYRSKEYISASKPLRLIIAGDNAEPEILGEYLRDLDLLIHEATYTQEVYESLPTKFLHTTAAALAKTAQKWGVKHLIATHISPRFSDPAPILEELRAHYRGECVVAEDFMSFTIRPS